jgi:hypothetical protein
MAWDVSTWTAGLTVTAAQMNARIRDNFKAIGDPWTAYTPVLTATTTNPTLGTGSSQLGRYVAAGKWITYQYRITFGTSGTAAGSGTYLISLPVAPATPVSNAYVGTGFCFDSSANGMGPVWLQVNGVASTLVMQFPATWPGGTLTSVNHVNLYPWAASDFITGTVTYEAA